MAVFTTLKEEGFLQQQLGQQGESTLKLNHHVGRGGVGYFCRFG